MTLKPKISALFHFRLKERSSPARKNFISKSSPRFSLRTAQRNGQARVFHYLWYLPRLNQKEKLKRIFGLNGFNFLSNQPQTLYFEWFIGIERFLWKWKIKIRGTGGAKNQHFQKFLSQTTKVKLFRTKTRTFCALMEHKRTESLLKITFHQ